MISRRNWQFAKDNRETYFVWRDMRRRCYNEKCKSFLYYGGRGITVCEEWKNDFDAFFLDMGRKPEGLTIERVNNDQGYNPSNCIWATYSEQNYNKRDSRKMLGECGFRKAPGEHGFRTTYVNMKCRCDLCTAADRRYKRERYRSCTKVPMENPRICPSG